MRGLDETCVNKEKCEPSVACARTRDWWKAHWDRLTYAPVRTARERKCQARPVQRRTEKSFSSPFEALSKASL
jgi:hypothetical protein